MLICHHITATKLHRAHRVFLEKEPLYIFYDFATDLVTRGWHENSALILTQGVSALLHTWNRGVYQRRPFDLDHFRKIKRLVESNMESISHFAQRTISTLDDTDAQGVKKLFRRFEKLLGPVGAAKGLHILAPNFFSLWDNPIAIAYHLRLDTVGSNRNSNKYFTFMKCQRRQSELLGNHDLPGITILKALDEYNYTSFTKLGYIHAKRNRPTRRRH